MIVGRTSLLGRLLLRRTLFALFLVSSCGPTALAQPGNLDFVTIGAAGNRAANESEAPGLEGYPIGAVPYEYRLTRTEVTVTQWLSFARAYDPFRTGDVEDPGLVGRFLRHNSSGYYAIPGTEQFPADMSWRYAAVFCNWLHNGQVSSADAFSRGAYDTSTFTQNADGSLNDQVSRSPGARFWIPSWDELTKGAYYDPNRYGNGADGFWTMPDGRNTPLISGFPADGGETNAGIAFLHGMDVGQYPQINSPWGLLDVSGGAREWTETVDTPASIRTRIVKGSVAGGTDAYIALDRIDVRLVSGPNDSFIGLRLAAAVPGPGVPSGVLLGVLWICGKRRRTRRA